LPTQLFEAAALVALFLILLWLRRRLAGNSRSEGMLTGAYLIGYALIRFCIEFLRGDPRAAVGFLSISQAISVCMVILGTASICYARFRRVEKEAR
jgi:phosphatidylglycerol:prolipoprotein diacylglycerol transferase